jgi:hypothetical protein
MLADGGSSHATFTRGAHRTIENVAGIGYQALQLRHLMAGIQLSGRQRHFKIVSDGLNGTERLAQIVNQIVQSSLGRSNRNGSFYVTGSLKNNGSGGHRVLAFPFERSQTNPRPCGALHTPNGGIRFIPLKSATRQENLAKNFARILIVSWPTIQALGTHQFSPCKRHHAGVSDSQRLRLSVAHRQFQSVKGRSGPKGLA